MSELVRVGEAAPVAASQHNIVAPVVGRDEHVVVNLLAGTADLLSADETRALENGEFSDAARSRGYGVDPAAEATRFRSEYSKFVGQRDTDEVQLFYAPTYACNFACSYCYQSEYPPEPAAEPRTMAEAFYRYVDATFAGRRKYVTLFGGEPLLSGARNHEAVEAIVDGAVARGLELAVVTNGYELGSYLDTLTRAKIREIQITIDGVGPLHDGRRPLKGGGATFERVVAGVEATLARDIAVNLRVVVDRENLAGLVPLARFAKERGWLAHRRFKTQLGRNYELHYCQIEQNRLYSRLELHRELYALAKLHPEVLELHRPAFGVARAVADNGALPPPLFDACPGCKTEWAFDATGRIYACTATVGKPGEALGTFYPEVRLDAAAVAEWQDRDVLAIEACRSCALQLACGGGCAAVAKNRTGALHSPDCRPVA